MKRIMLLAACVFAFLYGHAHILFTTASLTYTQDFNSLDTSGASLTTMPYSWSFHEWGGSSANTGYRANTGSATSGDTYSYGAAGSTDRALGSLCSSGVPNVSYGVRFVNKTAAYVNAVTITFKAEQWRRNGSGKVDSVLFLYSTAAGKTIGDTSRSSWIEVADLLMTSITTAVPASAVNGNDTAKVLTATIPVSLPANDTISFRWYDYNGVGNDDGLSIDSLTIVFNNGPPSTAHKPAIIALSPAPNTLGVPMGVIPSVTFDKNIVAGSSGNIYIKDRLTQTTQILVVSSANVTISGKVATLSGATLQSGRSYHITFDSTSFDTATFHSSGIYDTSVWVFETVPLEVPDGNEDAAIPFLVINPASNGYVSLHCSLKQSARLAISIHDAGGRALFRCTHQSMMGANKILLNTTLPAGIYFIRMTDGKRWGVARVEMQ